MCSLARSPPEGSNFQTSPPIRRAASLRSASEGGVSQKTPISTSEYSSAQPRDTDPPAMTARTLGSPEYMRPVSWASLKPALLMSLILVVFKVISLR